MAKLLSTGMNECLQQLENLQKKIRTLEDERITEISKQSTKQKNRTKFNSIVRLAM